MRKITKEVVGAFNREEGKKIGNTQSLEYQYGVLLFLHGNRIAIKENGKLYVSLCGWDTVTTRERLNGITGVCVTRKKGQTYLNGKPWTGALISVNDW